MPGYEQTSAFYNGGIDAPYRDDVVDDREVTMERYENLGATTILTSGTVYYSYFTARRTRDVTGVATVSSVVTATITSSLVGLYEETNSTTGALTLRASAANDVALWLAADTRYFKAFTAGWRIKAGRKYAVAVLSVATTPPILLGMPAVGATLDAQVAAIMSQSPKRIAMLTGQTALTATATPVAQTALPINIYAEVGTA
jgi:hypothetical protein